MRLPDPPATQPSGAPVIERLSAGTVLHRVHGSYPADTFNHTPQPTDLYGGRFDSLDGSYGYTYLGEVPAAAVAETICRDLPLDGRARQVPLDDLTGRRLTRVEVVKDLDILILHGAAMTQVQAPLALTKCETDQYETTRAWADSLRQWLPTVAGFRYRCRHDEDLLAYVLFDDGPPGPARPHLRAHGALRADPSSALALDRGLGKALVKQVVKAHNASLI